MNLPWKLNYINLETAQIDTLTIFTFDTLTAELKRIENDPALDFIKLYKKYRTNKTKPKEANNGTI